MYEEKLSKILQWFNDNKRTVVYCVAFIVIVCCAYLFGYYSGGRVLSGNGTGIDAVRNELKTVEEQELQSGKLIDAGTKQNNELGKSLDNIQQGITDSQAEADGIRDDITKSQNLVREQNQYLTSSEQIFRRICQRGKTEIPDR